MRLIDRIFRPQAPPESPPLAAQERVVTWAGTGDGAVVVATSWALWLPAKRPRGAADPSAAPAASNTADKDAGGPTTVGGSADPDRWQRLSWSEIHKAAWADGTLAVTSGVEVEPGVVADGPVRRIRLVDPRDLPAEVRTRVTRSVAYTSHHRLAAGGAVRVVARRVPGRDGLTWQLRFDDGVDRTDPAVRAQAEGILTEVRGAAG